MCKTYDAIYKLRKHVESDVLICVMGDFRIEGHLHDCHEEMGKFECYDEIITLKDATFTCSKHDVHKEFKWINIPSRHIKTFAFKCCEK